jgi:hypothetical protein
MARRRQKSTNFDYSIVTVELRKVHRKDKDIREDVAPGLHGGILTAPMPHASTRVQYDVAWLLPQEPWTDHSLMLLGD